MRAALFGLLFGVYLALLPRQISAGAARLSLAGAEALWRHGGFDLGETPLPATFVFSGRRDSLLGMGTAIVHLPVAALGATPLAASVFTALGASLVGVCFFSSLRRRGLAIAAALWATLVLQLATAVLVYARVPDGSIWGALFTVMWCDRLWSPARENGGFAALVAGASGALLMLLDDAYVAPVLCGTAYVLVLKPPIGARQRWTSSIGAALPLVLAVIALQLHRRALGGAMEPSGPLSLGLDGLLLSTGKSLFLYSPPALLGLSALPALLRAQRRYALFLVLVVSVALISIGWRFGWHGDPAFGPRRVVPLLPLFIEPLAWAISNSERASREKRWLTGGVVMAGLIVQLLGCAFTPTLFLRIVDGVKNGTGASGWFVESPTECHFFPQFSPLYGHYWLLTRKLRESGLSQASSGPPAAATPWKLLVPTGVNLSKVWPEVQLDLRLLDDKAGFRGLVAILAALLTTASTLYLLRRLLLEERR